MIKAWLFLHVLGFTLWVGGAIASMVAGVSAKREGREGIGVVTRAQAAIQKMLIGPGALLTVLSGLMLTFRATGMTGSTTFLAHPRRSGRPCSKYSTASGKSTPRRAWLRGISCWVFRPRN